MLLPKNGRSKPVAVFSGSGAVRDDRAGKVDHGEVVLRQDLPANAQAAEVVVPAVRALDNPAARLAGLTAPLLLAASAKVQADPAAGDFARGVVVVVAFVEAEVSWSTGTTRRAQRHRVERLPGEPFIVDVGAGQRDGDGNAAPVGEHVPLRAKLSTICRIGSGEAPPFGAFTEALSREHQVQSIPRFSS